MDVVKEHLPAEETVPNDSRFRSGIRQINGISEIYSLNNVKCIEIKTYPA